MSHATQWSHTFRILICTHCGAPLEFPAAGGQAKCTYCNHIIQVERRDEDADMQRAQQQQPTNEALRIQQLRAQENLQLLPPANLHHYVQGGTLAPHSIPAAFADWSTTRATLSPASPFSSQERLFFLVVLLDGALAKQGETLKRRALLETTLELLTAPQYRQILRGILARQSVRERDFDAALDWLRPCDPYPDDLQMDTAFRLSHAYLETAQGKWQAVFHRLGADLGEVPIAASSRALCGLLRANAHERLGALPVAIQQLSTLTAQTGAGVSLLAVNQVHPEMQLCTASLAQSPQLSAAAPRVIQNHPHHLPQVAARRAPKRLSILRLIPGFIFMAVGTGLSWQASATTEGALTSDGFPLSTFLFGMGGLFLLLGLMGVLGPLVALLLARQKEAHFDKVGIDGVATVLELSSTGLRINGNPQIKLRLQIKAGDMPAYELTKKKVVGYVNLASYQPGNTLPIRADSTKPTNVLF